MRTLAQRAYWLRTTVGLTNKELAALADVSDSYPNALEKGRTTDPTIGKVERIAAALRVDFDWLARGRGEPPTAEYLEGLREELKAAAAKIVAARAEPSEGAA